MFQYLVTKIWLFATFWFFISGSVLAQSFWTLTNSFPGGPKTGITLAHDTCLFVGLTAGLIRSCDGGNNFEPSLQASVLFSVFTSDSGMGSVFAGGAGLIYRSDDLGVSWDSLSLPSIYPITQFLEDHDGGLFAISGTLDVAEGFVGDGVFYSADGGLNWEKRNNGLGGYLSAERIAIDRHGRLYLAMADEYVTGNSGLFFSDNKGLLWKHIDVTINGRGVIENKVKVGRTTGLTISPKDSLYFSISGIAGSALVELNLSKHINAVEDNTHWKPYKVFDAVSWWLDRTLYNIHVAENGYMFSSTKGSINTGATYYSTDDSRSWQSNTDGLGLDIFGLRNVQHFAETSHGQLFMVQLLDERIYRTEIDRPTAVKNPREEWAEPRIYPNPVAPQGAIQLEVIDKYEVIHCQLFDAMGRSLRTEPLQTGKPVMIAPSTPGVYFIRLLAGPKGRTLRLVVQ